MEPLEISVAKDVGYALALQRKRAWTTADEVEGQNQKRMGVKQKCSSTSSGQRHRSNNNDKSSMAIVCVQKTKSPKSIVHAAKKNPC